MNASEHRPVRDSLPPLGPERGGIVVPKLDWLGVLAAVSVHRTGKRLRRRWRWARRVPHPHHPGMLAARSGTAMTRRGALRAANRCNA